jgi:hypothetical protein
VKKEAAPAPKTTVKRPRKTTEAPKADGEGKEEKGS